MKKLAILISFYISWFVSSAQEPIKPNESLCYFIKNYNLEYGDHDFLKNYLRVFDDKYDIYKNNEFEFQSKKDGAKKEVEKIISNISHENVYSISIEGKFGQYDFSNESFDLTHFSKTTFYNVDPYEANIPKLAVFYISPKDFSWDTDIGSSSAINLHYYIKNTSDFLKLKISKDSAQKIIASRTEDEKVNRNIYIKAYYSILNEKNNTIKTGGYGSPIKNTANGLYCYVYRMEIWGDKNMTNDLIKTIDANSLPPNYLHETKQKFIEQHKYKLPLVIVPREKRKEKFTIQKITAINCFSDDSALVIDEDGKIKLLKISTGESIAYPISIDERFKFVRISPTNKYIAIVSNNISNGSYGKIMVYDLKTGQLKSIFPAYGRTQYFTGIEFTSDEKYIVIIDGTSKCHLGDIENSNIVREFLEPFGNKINCVKVTTDMRYLITGGYQQKIHVFDFSTGQLIRTIYSGNPNRGITTICISPNGRYLVSNSSEEDKTIVIDLLSGSILKTLYYRNNSGVSTNVANYAVRSYFSQDGNYIVTSHPDFSGYGGYSCLWRWKKGDLVKIYNYKAYEIIGDYIIGGGDIKNTYIWYIKEDIIYAFFSKEIELEKKQLTYFSPKDEFETTSQYENRKSEAEKILVDILKKYSNKYESAVLEYNFKSKKLINESQTYSVVPSSAITVGLYNADTQKLIITIEGVTDLISITPTEAKSMKENGHKITAIVYDRLSENLTDREWFNCSIIHPITGKKYSWGFQK